MLRKTLIVSLCIFLLLGGLISLASAHNIANTSQKGSLLIFPKIMAYGVEEEDFPLIDTLITIGNDNTIDVYLKCYWVDENQSVDDFQFRMTANQPIAFSAWGNTSVYTPDGAGMMELPPFRNKVGQLICWAVDAGDSTQIRFNHLYGESLIVWPAGLDPVPPFDEFPFLGAAPAPAWAFRALKDPSPDSAGIPGQLPLDGITYDACPKYLISNFIPSGIAFPLPAFPDLTLAPCRQDLRQDRIPTCTKAKFDVWNHNEVKFTGAYQCLKCWYEGFLEMMGDDAHQKGPGHGGSKFTYNVLRGFAARFRVMGVYSTVCVGKTKGCPKSSDADFAEAWGGPGKTTPFVGHLYYSIQIPEEFCENGACPPALPMTGFALRGAGSDADGQILWNAADPWVPEHPKR